MITTSTLFLRRAALLVTVLLVLLAAAVPAGADADAVDAPSGSDETWTRLKERGRAAAGATAHRTAAAAGASSCSFDAGTATVTVEVEGLSETLQEHAIRVDGIDITFGGAPCDGATVLNTDDIVVTGTDSEDDVVVDLRGGPFEPGFPPEPTGISEIEFSVNLGGPIDFLGIVGTSGPDRFVLGRGGVGMNGDGDADLVMANKPTTVPVVFTFGGRDVVTARGGRGTGGALRQFLIVDGGARADRLVGGNRWNLLVGGGGGDRLTGGPAGDELIGRGGRDVVRGRGGQDIIYPGAGNDRLIGGAGNDAIFGGRGNDLLRGGPGNDFLNGGPGIDTCRPGPGRDTLVRCER